MRQWGEEERKIGSDGDTERGRIIATVDYCHIIITIHKAI